MPELSPFALPDPPSLFRQLFAQLKERIAPPPEPELKLESQPIPVKDIWSQDRSLTKRAVSVGLHVAVIGILMLPFWRPVRVAARKEEAVLMPQLFVPGTSLPKMKHLAGGGAPLRRLLPPKFDPVNAHALPVTAPLKLTPTEAVANLPIPAFGDPGRIPGPPGNSVGHSGAGPGGAGSSASGGGDCPGGVCTPGGDVTQPIPIYSPDPQYSDAARKAKFQGTVVVGVIIGADGKVYDPKVVQPLGMGLDQKALEAVMLWRFKPARKHGKAVRVMADIQVNFHLY